MRVLIVGGVAGGMSAATRTRRLDEEAEIVVFEKGQNVSFANCGLPYFIGGTIKDESQLLVQTPERLRRRFNLDVRVRHEVIAIDRAGKKVTVRDLRQDRVYEEPYDRLLLSPGAEPIRPPIPGVDSPGVFTLRDLEDMDRIRAAAETVAPSDERPVGGHAVIIGGGYIGLEMAENLAERGLEVTVAEMLSQVMPPLDPEMARPLQEHLRSKGVRLLLDSAVVGVEGTDHLLEIALKDGTRVECDFAVLSVGVRPNSELARQAGLAIGETGGIEVDEHMRTSDPDIYAVGDAVEVTHLVTDRKVLMPLAGPANRQGRVAADNLCGRSSTFGKVQGTAVVKVFEFTAAVTGANEKTLREEGIRAEKVYIHPRSHAGYYPGGSPMTLKLLFAPDEGKLLGAQIVGREGVDKRIDVLATAMRAGMTTFDLEDLELAYAPPYGTAKDAINMAGFVASNVVRGDLEIVHVPELTEEDWLLDVRTPAEFEEGHVPGAVNIPLSELRDRLDEVPRDRRVAVVCSVGIRAYNACRALRQHGIDACNVPGGYRTYGQFKPDQPGE